MLYIDHKDLKYLDSQNKLNQRHMKWVEYMQNFSFVLNHRSEQSNKVAYALNRRIWLTIMRVEVLGFDDLKNLYETDFDFAEPSKACKNHITNEQNKWVDYFI